MFRFANDVSHHNSQVAEANYPALANFIKKQMEVHSHSYVVSMTQIRTLHPDITNPLEAAEILSVMLYPYGWKIHRDGVTLRIKAKG